MLVFLAALAHASCPATPAAVELGVVALEQAFRALDADGVAAAAADLDVLTACLDTPITIDLAVRVHAAHGYASFVAGDSDRAAQAFAAARRVDPAWVPDPKLVPKGHPIHALASKLDPREFGVEAAPKPRAGTLYFDGVRTLDRPEGTPTVAQWAPAGDGRVTSGAYAWPDAGLPPYDAAEGQPRTARKRRPVGGWLAVTGVGAAASVASFYVASRAHAAWETADTGPEVVAHYRETNLLVASGATFGVVAAVGGIGAIATVAF